MLQAEAMDFAAPLLADDFIVFVDHIEDFFAHKLEDCTRDRVSRTNCSSLTVSARVWGESSTSAKAASNRAGAQSSRRSFDIIFRRCEKLRFTILISAASSSSESSGAARRFNTIQAESTSGSGKKHPAGILKQVCGSSCNCTSGGRKPYSSSPA